MRSLRARQLSACRHCSVCRKMIPPRQSCELMRVDLTAVRTHFSISLEVREFLQQATTI